MIDGLVLLEAEALARHTAYRTGGPCDAFLVVHRRDAVGPALEMCRERGWARTVIGAGTRTLVRDGGLAGAVLRLGQGFVGVERDGERLRIGAATPVPVAVEAAIAAGLGGLEGMAAVPGSVGASVLLDPGWDEVLEAVTVASRGRERELCAAELRAKGGQPLVLEVVVRLRPAEAEALREGARRAVESAPSPWSWYEPPPRGDLRRLLVRVDLGDVRLRRVTIPDAVPEMLVNLGEGTARDLQLLHKSALERVERQRGVKLAPRVRWVGSHTGRSA